MKNPKIDIRETEILSDRHYTLKQVSFGYVTETASEVHKREVFDRGNGAAVLLYDPVRRTVVLTRQFRMPTYLNQNPGGMMIEACAGMVEEADPEQTVRREAIEETGYHINQLRKAFSAYMSPGAVTEILHCYVAEYSEDMKRSAGGGLEHEHEHIEILEMPFSQATEMIKTGEIKDAKTIMLLQFLQLQGLMEL